MRADLASLPADLDRIDDWIADGVIGGGEPNAADYQIAPSVRLPMTFDDLRPSIEGRPCGEMAMRIVPDFPGRTPPVFPSEWLAGLRPLEQGAGRPKRHPLARPERVERRPQLRAVGEGQLGVELEQRHQHEAPRGHLRVRQREPLGAQLEVAEQEQVDVDRPRPVAGAAEDASVLGLDRLADVEQLPRARARC